MRLQRQQQRDICHIKQQGITPKGALYSLHTKHNIKISNYNFLEYMRPRSPYIRRCKRWNMAAMLRTYYVSVSPLLAQASERGLYTTEGCKTMFLRTLYECAYSTNEGAGNVTLVTEVYSQGLSMSACPERTLQK